jgi:hypothetical protein
MKVDDPTGDANDPTGSRSVAGTEKRAVFDRRRLLVHGWDLVRLSVALPVLAPLVAACGGSEEREAAPSAAKEPSGTKAAEPMPSESASRTMGEAPTPPESAGSGQGAAAAQTAEEAGAAADDTRLVNEIESNAALVSSLQFHVVSPKPDQRCEICRFFTATGDGRGKCQLFARGRVPVGGWCASWQPIPAPSKS